MYIFIDQDIGTYWKRHIAYSLANSLVFGLGANYIMFEVKNIVELNIDTGHTSLRAQLSNEDIIVSNIGETHNSTMQA